METDHKMPGNKQWAGNEDKRESTHAAGTADSEKKPSLAPDKDKDYKVLNKDGSLADLNQGAEDRGALEGTVGLGT